MSHSALNHLNSRFGLPALLLAVVATIVIAAVASRPSLAGSDSNAKSACCCGADCACTECNCDGESCTDCSCPGCDCAGCECGDCPTMGDGACCTKDGSSQTTCCAT